MAYEYTRENPLQESACTLVSPVVTRDSNGVEKVDKDNETRKEVFCSVGGIYQKEFFEAYQSGIKPQIKVQMFRGDYSNEEIVELYDDVQDKVERYIVYRRYPIGDQIELYLRKDTGEWN